MQKRISEKWKSIPGYEGRYEISNLGRVKSLKRTFICGQYKQVKRNIDEKIMTLIPHWRGYMTIKLRGNKYQKFFIQRLVAQAFILNPENKPLVNHLDCNKKNNFYKNLEWATYSENTRYYFKMKNAGIKPIDPEEEAKDIIEANALADEILSHF